MPISALIHDLEAATEGSRELDAQVNEHDAVAPNWERWKIPCNKGYEFTWSSRLPFYTTSLDAALTLVPEGTWYWHIRKHKSTGRAHDAIVTLRKPGKTADKVQFQVDHKTPALALCIAALKAREVTKEPKHG